MNDKFQNIVEKIKSIILTKRGKISVITGGSIIIVAIISTITAININSAKAVKVTAQNLKVQNLKTNVSSVETSPSASSSSPAASSSPSAGTSSTGSSAQSAAKPAAANVPVTSVDFSSRYVTLRNGATYQLAAKITPVNATDKSLTWTTSNSLIATVDSNGVVTGKSAGKAYIRATSTNGQRDTCTVTVTSGSGYTGGSGKSGTGSTGSVGGNGTGGSGSGSGDSHVANYQGVNKTMTFTDEITGIRQTVEFLGMGAGYCEVAAANADLTTTAAMGNSHYGEATAKLIKSNVVIQSEDTGVGKNGSGDTFVIGNLTAGTYTLTLTAHDGTVVAKYSFTVDSSGNVK